jgi:Cu/Ag efflux protein CusF
VTAVGANSVTIKTSSGTKTYGVTSTSDIDKNGEAKLSDLKVGDAVRFDTSTVNGKAVIDHLHAGNEALDRPAGPPRD